MIGTSSDLTPASLEAGLSRFWELPAARIRLIEEAYEAAQGSPRLGHWLQEKGDAAGGPVYSQAGLTVLDTLLHEPYLSTDAGHQGLILHSVYHRPNGWDYVPPGRRVPCGESSMWGDYHAREAALYVQRVAADAPYLTFWGP